MVSQLQKMRTAVLRVEQSQLAQPSDPEQMQAPPPGSAPPSGLRCRLARVYPARSYFALTRTHTATGA